MDAIATPIKLDGLARLLVQEELLSEREAEQIQEQANTQSVPCIRQIVQTRRIPALQIAQLLAVKFGFPLLDMNAVDPDHIPTQAINAKMMQLHRILPLQSRGNTLYIALSDPTNLHALDDVQFQTGMMLSPIVVEDDKLSKWITRITNDSDITLESLRAEGDLELKLETESQADLETAVDDDDAPVVRFIHKMLIDAINMDASDLHFEPYEKFYRIRFRVDGELREIARPPLAIKDKMASRIKVISRLDISEKRLPQDGRMKLALSKSRAIDFRVSTLPTLQGEKIVIRILDPASASLGIDALGYEPAQRELLLAAVKRPYGMVLVTGPTGSGKTVSLYTCLNILNQPGVNISTVEDPAEINLPGVNQVNVNEKAGLNFATALRAFLRQDPDIIMVGEIRDLETADIAVKAAQTGHMVLSTLHTNDAPGTLSRLMNMGVAPFNIASSVILITAQRLARRLCKECKQPVNIPKPALLQAGFTEADFAESWQLYGPKEGGCDNCSGSGYRGRVGIYQVMPVTEEMSRIIMQNGTSQDISDQAKREGVKDLRQSGLLKVKQGLTSLEEIEACTNE
ncbi:MAG: type IV-A pilus assembly ATPase PilB [Methylobacillus sp.]|jgi:type IV pilus assembly protein PilB|nr:type IV-A pilus assembly ATPase PilB [Methylobacillus sp.]